MNILHMSPYYPSPQTNHAGGVCMGKEIETLRKHNKVYILTFLASDYDRKLAAAHPDKDCSYVSIEKHNRILHVIMAPLFPAYFAARTSARYTLKLLYCLNKYKIDAIHMEYASMGQYIWLIKRFFPNIKVCLVEHDVTAQSYERKLAKMSGMLRWYYFWEWRKIRKYEGIYCRNADVVLTFNEKDKKLLEQYYGTENTHVMAPYCGFDEEKIADVDIHKNKEYANICFLGQMGREENYIAAQRLIHIGQRVQRIIPELHIYIVGNDPPQELSNEQNEFITVTGYVEDVDIYLERAQLAVFPLTLGAGIKVKVLRSLALGTPVITGKIGAEGIDEDGEVISLAETDEDYVNMIVELIRSPLKCREISEKSRRHYLNHFIWSRSDELLNKLYQER